MRQVYYETNIENQNSLEISHVDGSIMNMAMKVPMRKKAFNGFPLFLTIISLIVLKCFYF